MLDISKLSDDELWLLTCGVERFHDLMRRNTESYTEEIIEMADDLRDSLETEVMERQLDYRRWNIG